MLVQNHLNLNRTRGAGSRPAESAGGVPTLAQSISKTLAAEIIDGRLLPGAKLDEVSLAERFDVSRSPVRDALRHLAGMRLVEHLPRRGFTVRGIDEEGLRDLYEGLAEVEAICAGLCAMRATLVERMQIERLFERSRTAAAAGDFQAYVDLNDQFHAAIYAGTHNVTLESVANDLRQRLAPLRIRPFFEPQRLKEAIEEHEALVLALLRQDRRQAIDAMQKHAASTGVRVLERIRPHQT